MIKERILLSFPPKSKVSQVSISRILTIGGHGKSAPICCNIKHPRKIIEAPSKLVSPMLKAKRNQCFPAHKRIILKRFILFVKQKYITVLFSIIETKIREAASKLAIYTCKELN